MDLSAKNAAYKSYLDQAKEAFSQGDKARARALFLKAADITNQISLEISNPELKTDYYNVTKSIISFVQNECVNTPVKQANNSSDANDKKNEDMPDVEIKENNKITLKEALDNLNNLIGLDAVKAVVNDWVKQIQIFQARKAKKLKVHEMNYHLVFTGNPGTGKTTVARIMGQIYCALGILPKGQLVEVDKSKLVVGYVNQTGPNTRKIIDQAMGGVLFIDEAYSLAQGGKNDFGMEAINTLLKVMEDKRNEFAVIVAGYDEPMQEFIDSNPGLSSRFKTFIHFDDYNADELLKIFLKQCKDSDYKLDDNAKKKMQNYFQQYYDNRDENFGNARDVRNILESIITNQSRRLFNIENPTTEQLMLITEEDLPSTLCPNEK